MLIVLGLLLAATWSTVGETWDDLLACPAHCVPAARHDMCGKPLAWAKASTFFLVYQYTCFVMQLGEKIVGRATRLRNVANRDGSIRKGLKSHTFVLKMYEVVRGLIEGDGSTSSRNAVRCGNSWAGSL
jgi:hypothetical protein